MKRVAGQRAGDRRVREQAGSAGATGGRRSLRRTAHDQPRLGAGNRAGRVTRRAGQGGNSGINGESSGKDGVNTLGDHALVFSELRRVTCGVAVHKAVDNRCDVRITGGILWTRCGHERNLK